MYVNNQIPMGFTPGAIAPTNPFAPGSYQQPMMTPIAPPVPVDVLSAQINQMIQARMQATTSVPATNQQTNGLATAPKLPPGISQADVDWALQVEQRQQQGGQVTPQEAARYQEILTKLMAAKNPQTPQQPTNNQSPSSTLPAGISQADVDWALQIEERQKQGGQVTQDEINRYQALLVKLQNAKKPTPPQTQATTPAANPNAGIPGVTQADIDFALKLEEDIKKGIQPAPADAERYQKIAVAISQAVQAKKSAESTQTTTDQPVNPTSTRDWGNWSKPYTPPKSSNAALKNLPPANLTTTTPDVHDHDHGDLLNPDGPDKTEEKKTENDLATKAQQMGLDPKEIEWALEIEHRVQDEQYQPTEAEMKRYLKINETILKKEGLGTTTPTQTETLDTNTEDHNVIPNNYPKVLSSFPSSLNGKSQKTETPQTPQKTEEGGFLNGVGQFFTRMKNAGKAFWKELFL